MKKAVILSLLLATLATIAQNKIEKLQYGKTAIPIPETCAAESVSKINDCNGFSAMWFAVESAGSGMRKKTLKQIEQQIKYTAKQNIKFNSQNQLFEGMRYEMEDGSYRIVGFGEIDTMPIMVILGFKTEVKTNSDLTDFDKNFIMFI